MPGIQHSVSYIVSRFPKLTETFVLNEILEMERLGVRVEIYPLLRERERVVQPEVQRLVQRARYVRYLSLAMVRAHAHFLRRQPLAYCAALLEVLKGTWRSPNFFAGAVVFFPKAVAFAYHAQRHSIEHVHAQFANHPALVALIVHRLTGIPFSFTARGSDIHVDRTMLGQKIAGAAFAITVSRSNRDVMLAASGGKHADAVHVVYGGIDTRRFTPRQSASGDEKLRIVCVARFEEVKGHAHLLRACALLQERGVEFECHLVGDGELRPGIERQIATSGLQHRVTLHGACTQAQVIEELEQATVFVLATVPSSNGKREGIPNVLKEAMACGLATVATDISGIPELVEHARTGLLVPPLDETALADALQLLGGDPELRHRLGQAARQFILEQFDLAASTRRRASLFFGEHARVRHQSAPVVTS
jgi:colanic acid/amylovoran biosynthesis glycosyltransferase